MKYFVMIDGEQRGPYELAQLPEIGLRPDTYVWCKGMERWEQAMDVADICRLYRQRLSGPRPAVDETAASEASVSSPPGELPDGRQAAPQPHRFSRYGLTPEMLEEQRREEESKDWLAREPVDLRVWAWVVTLFMFFPTGIFAIINSNRSRSLWRRATSASNHEEAENLAREAHDACRKSKMFVGISFFVGLIFFAMAVNGI